MMRLVAIVFGGVTTTAIVVLLFLLYRYADEAVVETAASSTGTPSTETSNPRKNSEKRWLEKLAVKKRPENVYPVTLIHIEIPFVKKRVKKAFAIQWRNVDDYQFFCLQRVIDQTGLHAAIQRRKDRVKARFYGMKKPELEKLLKALEPYGLRPDKVVPIG